MNSLKQFLINTRIVFFSNNTAINQITPKLILNKEYYNNNWQKNSYFSSLLSMSIQIYIILLKKDKNVFILVI